MALAGLWENWRPPPLPVSPLSQPRRTSCAPSFTTECRSSLARRRGPYGLGGARRRAPAQSHARALAKGAPNSPITTLLASNHVAENGIRRGTRKPQPVL